MGAALGSGRKERFGHIEGLVLSEVEVLKALMNWNHAARRSTAREVAGKCSISSSSVSNALYNLKTRGIVRRSLGRSWFIVPSIKEQIISEFGQKDSSSDPIEVQSTPE